MQRSSPIPDHDFARASTGALVRRAFRYFFRALRLRCPECGVSPIYVPLRRTRSWHDWVTPLDGCPRCGYAYEREPGYFLLAIWGVHYFIVTGVGLALGLLVDALFDPPFWTLIWIVGAATVAFAAAFVRHAKAIYIAVDHYFDPHVRRSPAPPVGNG